MVKSLYNEIIDYLEDELKGVKDNHHYKTNGPSAAYYALCNATGHIKAIKEGRDLEKKKKPAKSYK